MSSEDIRYARRSETGVAIASAARIGRLPTVEWLEFMVTLTERKFWVSVAATSLGSACGERKRQNESH
jgi:hypothetical protein